MCHEFTDCVSSRKSKMSVLTCTTLTCDLYQVPGRLEFLTGVFDAHAREIGVSEIRQDPDHNMVGTCTAEPTDQGCETLELPISYILVYFGTAIPNLTKFKAPSREISLAISGFHLRD